MNVGKRRKICGHALSKNTTSALFSFRGFYGWSPRQRNHNSAEETLRRLACREVGETLLRSLPLNANAQMSIAILVRATHLCIRRSRIPTSKMSNRLPQWEGKAVGVTAVFADSCCGDGDEQHAPSCSCCGRSCFLLATTRASCRRRRPQQWAVVVRSG
jgi:hypothetical protein